MNQPEKHPINEFAEWRAMCIELRARRARLAGRPVDAQVLCEDLDLEMQWSLARSPR